MTHVHFHFVCFFTLVKKAVVVLQSLFYLIHVYRAYLHTAQSILQSYAGEEPFPAFLKKFFSLHRKFRLPRPQTDYPPVLFLPPGMPSAIPRYPNACLSPCSCAAVRRVPLLKALKPGLERGRVLELPEKILLVGGTSTFVQPTSFRGSKSCLRKLNFQNFALPSGFQPDIFARGKRRR